MGFMNLENMPPYEPGIYEDESDLVEHGLPENDAIWDTVDAADRYQGGARNITHEDIPADAKVHATQEWASKGIVEHFMDHPSNQRIHVVQTGGKRWIMDGHHRYLANKLSGRSTPATIFDWASNE